MLGDQKAGGGKRLNASLPEPGPHILVVDDDELIRQQIERLETGDIDLVVTDIQLPGLSG